MQLPGAFLSWRAHPLLFPFVRGAAGGAQRLQVPPADRPAWSARWLALNRELTGRRDGYHEAVQAHLMLLLVEASRLAADVVEDLRLNDEPLLAEVFGCIKAHYRERISLKEVALAMNLSLGHLTTIIKRKTGRPVLEWIAERRMAEARRLLVETDPTAAEVGQRVGYDDPGYFVRFFRRTHGATPLRHGERLRAALPRSQLTLLADGHYAVLQEGQAPPISWLGYTNLPAGTG
jgi:AraC family transcriptional regulator, transcriptional activator of pobA